MPALDTLTPAPDLVARFPKTSLAVHAVQVLALASIFVWNEFKPNPLVAQLAAEKQRVEAEQSRATKFFDDLLKARGELSDLSIVSARLRDRNVALEAENHKLSDELSNATALGDGHKAHVAALEKRISELESTLAQARPVTIEKLSLSKDSEVKLRSGIKIQFKGTSHEHIDIVYDGSQHLGIPKTGVHEAIPLRYVESIGAYLGIARVTLLDGERRLEAALVRFPAEWTFVPSK